MEDGFVAELAGKGAVGFAQLVAFDCIATALPGPAEACIVGPFAVCRRMGKRSGGRFSGGCVEGEERTRSSGRSEGE